MTHDIIGDLAATLRAYDVRCEIALERETWIVRVGDGLSAHADLETAIEAAVVTMAALRSESVAAASIAGAHPRNGGRGVSWATARNMWRRGAGDGAQERPRSEHIYAVMRGEKSIAYYGDRAAAERAVRDIFRGATVT